ncbi:Uncharacterised protein [Bordetella pertussis]|nr:Uncharacterised protein [Bordetella pertussis]
MNAPATSMPLRCATRSRSTRLVELLIAHALLAGSRPAPGRR